VALGNVVGPVAGPDLYVALPERRAGARAGVPDGPQVGRPPPRPPGRSDGAAPVPGRDAGHRAAVSSICRCARFIGQVADSLICQPDAPNPGDGTDAQRSPCGVAAASSLSDLAGWARMG